MREDGKKLLSLIAVFALALGAGCVGEEAPIENGECHESGYCPGQTGEDPDGTEEGKEDSWNRANDPQNFGNDFVYNWEELNGPELAQGSSEIIPWPDTYWPMQGDGYNARWNGDALSPVELYDQAFNNWTPPEGFAELRRFEEPRREYDAAYYEQIGDATRWAHERGGNYRTRQMWNADGTMNESVAAECDRDGDNAIDTDAPESCDFNGDGTVGYGDDWHGLEGWWGHCHAWAPAAYSAPEPQHPVTINGVTFEIADIKALIEATYEGGSSVFLGGRCNTREVERDEHGRIISDECRDTNAGAFHVVALNVIGRLGRSFVIDATYDYQVWNQPVRDYNITLQEEVTLEQALALLGRTDVNEYPYNSEAERFVHVQMDFRYVVEGHATTTPYIPQIDSFTRTHRYDYLLELDQAGNILGGEWIDDNPHPDFIWSSTENSDVRSGRYWGSVIISRANVQTLIDMSTSTEPPAPEGNERPYDSTPVEGGLAIPDNDPNGVSDTIQVEDSLTISGLRVNVDITHTYRGDLTVELIHNGTTVTLISNQGGSEDNLVESFDVADFNGQDATGQWTLRVVDGAGYDEGTLNSWRLTVITE